MIGKAAIVFLFGSLGSIGMGQGPGWVVGMATAAGIASVAWRETRKAQERDAAQAHDAALNAALVRILEESQ